MSLPSTLLIDYAIFQHLKQSIPSLVLVPYPDCAVSSATCQKILLWIPGTGEHLFVVALHHSALLWESLSCFVHIHEVAGPLFPAAHHIWHTLASFELGMWRSRKKTELNSSIKQLSEKMDFNTKRGLLWACFQTCCHMVPECSLTWESCLNGALPDLHY